MRYGCGVERREAARKKGLIPTSRNRRKAKPRGKAFAKGANSLNGEVFRRGVDLIPRGSVSSLYTMVLNDDGELARVLGREKGLKDQPARAARVMIAQSLLRAIRNPARILKALEQIGDRLEGTPVKKVETVGRRSVVFYNSAGPLPPQLVGSGSTPPGPHDVTVPSIAAPLLAPAEVATRLPEEVREIAQRGEGEREA